MTRDRDFKRLVRTRMERTGETYTAARAALLDTPPPTREAPSAPAQAVPTPAAPDRTWLDGVDVAARRFYDRTVRSFFDTQGRLRSIPTRRRAKVVVLFEILARFEPYRDYPEAEVNALIGAVHPDFATLRRELVDYRWLTRENGVYRLATEWPLWSATLEQEVEPFESAWFSHLGPGPD
ncbi:DUF2087 domain-containing protein [Brevibacterium litoralis]|uniref:DUF2087 domain-containing protein n=1 Tax=Brevibacterium litoralis TaxID=3138935 RepID=UPI0032EF75CD